MLMPYSYQTHVHKSHHIISSIDSKIIGNNINRSLYMERGSEISDLLWREVWVDVPDQGDG